MDSFVNFLSAEFLSEIYGMNAENTQRQIQGESMAYTEEHYAKAREHYLKMLSAYYEECNKKKR